MLTHDALLADIDAAALEPGELAFWWMGQMSYIVKVGGRVLYFDPFLAPRPTRRTPPMLSAGAITHAGFVFGSHDHGDHIDPLAIKGIAAASPQARFVCSRVASGKVISLGVPAERVIGLDEGSVFAEGGLRISAIAAAHEFFDRHPQLGYPYLCFIVQADGVTLLHTGDTLRYDGMIAKLKQWDFDLIFAPINGRDAARYARKCIGNMTYQETVDLAGELQPRLTVPGHYDMFADNSGDPQAFADYMRVKFPGLAFWIGEHGARVVLPARRPQAR